MLKALKCPACTGKKTFAREFKYNEQSRELRQCRSCGHAFDQNYQSSFDGYASGDYGMVNGAIPNFDRDLILAQTLISSFLIRPGDKILDYGAGWGGLSIRISEISRKYSLGIKVNCLEPIDHLAKSINEMEPTIDIHATIDSCRNNDFVIAKEVIEHTNNPMKFLKELASSMKIGSNLVITCPGHPNALSQTPGMASDYQERNHLHFFTRKSISALIERCGLFDYSFIALMDHYPNLAKAEYTSIEKAERIITMLSRRQKTETDHMQILLRLKKKSWQFPF